LFEDNNRIPLFAGEKQRKQPIHALRRPNATLQVVDQLEFDANSPTLSNSGILAADQGN
jgi:hypothetical protein